MIKQKRNIIILILAIVIYFGLTACYQFMFVDNSKNVVYIVNKDYMKGEIIKKEDISRTSIDKLNEEYIDYEDINNIVAKQSICKGEVLLKSMIQKQSEYLSANENKEIISLKIQNADDNISYQITKGNIVNVYYTGKTSQAEAILNNMSQGIVSSNNLIDGYMSVRLYQNIEILDVFDKYGNSINQNNDKRAESSLIDTIMIQVDKEEAIKTNNLKNYGVFTLSLIK